MNEATLRQIQAANPRNSTWLSANAGSGKTRVLTDRVARLLLDGASPQNILCLTYTKAAASEMQNRLFKRLGAWAMIADEDLRKELAGLGVEGLIGARQLADARTLFARAIETPGGLKIQTIHSFCASLLRSFPLESGVSPQFTEMDDRASRQLMTDCLEMLSDGPQSAVIHDLVRHVTDEDLLGLARDVCSRRDALSPPLDEAGLRALLALDPQIRAEDLCGKVFLGGEDDLFRTLAGYLAGSGKTDAKAAEVLEGLIGRPRDFAALAELEGLCLFGASAKAPFQAKIGTFPTKGAQKALADVMPALDDLMRRVETARRDRLGLLALERSGALHRFAAAFLPLYQNAKLLRGWLDFDDLILKARDLLTDTSVAQWVLYRLDGGIEHILIDEAQDTSPVQWQVIEALAQEVTAGHGAQEAGRRTLFVVGDKKQSIYSFQGADPEAFDKMADQFRDRLEGGTGLSRLELLHSFRSARAVLDTVDTVFDGDGGTGLGRDVRHLAFHEALPGRVDLWPVMPPGEATDDGEWYRPVDTVAPSDAKVLLAEAIAGEIRALIDRHETIPLQNGSRRPVHEGDFLILVQSRGLLFREIIAACKRRNLEIAGADRLRLGAELAVRDLRALLAFLVTPEDDLSLAAALRSPLLGWSEGELFDLAAHRGEVYLWQALRGARDLYPKTLEILNDLRREADFLRPYELLDRILLRHGGRPRLLGRLGIEAEDGIDEMLTQALAYERMEIPSLTGFLAWLDADDVDVRRQVESAGKRIRVMSVHGAKGLESPIVILPDTLVPPKPIKAQLLTTDTGGVIWRSGGDTMPDVMVAARDRVKASEAAERNRLLYVAMTRAETWLIVCGAGQPDRLAGTWYEAVEKGLANSDTAPLDTPSGPGLRHELGDWSAGPALEIAADPAALPVLPGWYHRVAPPPVEGPALVKPSGLGGAKALLGEVVDTSAKDEVGEEAAMLRGTRIHLLLEHLPRWAREDRAERAPGLLHDPDNPLDDAAIAELVSEAEGVLENAELAPLLARPALLEVELAAPLPHVPGRHMIGAIDRLIVEDGRVLAIDYKSNRQVPATPDEVPLGLLRQMGAYASALQQIYPDHEVTTALLWTRTASLMTLPTAQVMAAFHTTPLP